MATQQTGMFSTKEAQDKYDEWSKDDIYEAYLSENRLRVELNKEVNKLRRVIIDIKHAIKAN